MLVILSREDGEGSQTSCIAFWDPSPRCAGSGWREHCCFCHLPSAFCHLPSALCLLPSAFCFLPSAFCFPLRDFTRKPRDL